MHVRTPLSFHTCALISSHTCAVQCPGTHQTGPAMMLYAISGPDVAHGVRRTLTTSARAFRSGPTFRLAERARRTRNRQPSQRQTRTRESVCRLLRAGDGGRQEVCDLPGEDRGERAGCICRDLPPEPQGGHAGKVGYQRAPRVMLLRVVCYGWEVL
eukprot:1941321-Rhodomonas_salina.1